MNSIKEEDLSSKLIKSSLNFFQMAWEAHEEEAMNIVSKHMRKMRIEKKKEINELYSRHLFPRQGQNWTDVKWTTNWGVAFVTMWDEEYRIKNIEFAMIQEMMGLEPMKYCIVYNKMPNFFKRLFLLIKFLPQKNMCFYPPPVILEPPFDHSPWREIG